MRAVPDEDRYFMVAVDQYEDRCIKGVLFHGNRKQGIPYDSLLELLSIVDSILDSMNCPRQTFQLRSFPGIKSPVFNIKEGEENRREGRLATFCLYVKYRYHASWQGTLTSHGEKKAESFKSVLDLVCLFDRYLGAAPVELRNTNSCSAAIDFYGGGSIVGKLWGQDSCQVWSFWTEEGKRVSFSIRILFHEHSTWQGVIYWHEAGVRQQFRSFKEMFYLMASAVKAKEEKGVLYRA